MTKPDAFTVNRTMDVTAGLQAYRTSAGSGRIAKPSASPANGNPVGGSVLGSSVSGGGAVAILGWPEEDGRRSVLAAAGRLRLLLVDPSAPAPVAVDPREDWVRLPCSEEDLEARVLGLIRRSQPSEIRIVLDDHGLLHCGDDWVALPETEAALMAALLAAAGSVVSRSVLVEAAWPGGSPTRNVLDVHMVRLRRRIAELGIEIRTVRSRGYALSPH